MDCSPPGSSVHGIFQARALEWVPLPSTTFYYHLLLLLPATITAPVLLLPATTNYRCCCCVASVVSDSVRPHRRQPTRLPRSWDSPGKNTGVGCRFLLQTTAYCCCYSLLLPTTAYGCCYYYYCSYYRYYLLLPCVSVGTPPVQGLRPVSLECVLLSSVLGSGVAHCASDSPRVSVLGSQAHLASRTGTSFFPGTSVRGQVVWGA